MKLENENIVGELNLLLINMPEEYSSLEKLRWLYLKLGKMFCYDYRIVSDPSIVTNGLDFEKNYIGRYQTCAQISNIANIMFNQIPGVKSNIIERKMDYRGHQQLGLEHVANEVIVDGVGKFILDLTLDLYLIQSGFKTQHFGLDYFKDHKLDLKYTQEGYDIISLPECRMIDKKIGLLPIDGYANEKQNEYIIFFEKQDFSNMSAKEIINFKLKYLSKLVPQFKGHHEGKLLLNNLISEMLKVSYREFNLTYKNDNTDQIVTCFVIYYKGEEIWLLYSNTSGIISTSKDKIEYMLTHGWKTRSNTLNTMFEENSTIKK